jgi:hypothetical protein
LLVVKGVDWRMRTTSVQIVEEKKRRESLHLYWVTEKN